jgi:Flp pilus assembly protein TadD
VGETITAFFLLYVRPVKAISQILDHGRLLFAILAALAISVLLHLSMLTGLVAQQRPGHPTKVPVQQQQAQKGTQAAPNVDEDGDPVAPAGPGGTGALGPAAIFGTAGAAWIGLGGITAPLGGLAIVFIPAIIFVRAASGFGSFPVLLRSDYVSLLMCCLMCWAAAYLPLTPIVLALGTRVDPAVMAALFIAANLYFAFLVALSIRTLMGVGFGSAIGLTAIGCAAAVLGVGLSDFAGPLRYYMMSPFLLYYGYMMFGGDVRALGDGLRSRQHLQQQLQFATTNPRDADAHYQLGLIYQKRRQYTEAIARFQKAIEIDPKEADATLQLGRIAREQGRFDDAIRFLKTAAALDDKLASSEVWRELGASYYGASQFEEAVSALQKYTDRRAYDPEGLYWYGKTLKALKRVPEAKAAFEQCVEAVETTPKHLRAHVRKWSGVAKKEL